MDPNTLQLQSASQPVAAAPQSTSISGKIGLPSAQVDPNTLQIPSAPKPVSPSKSEPAPFDKFGTQSAPIDQNTLQYITGPPAPKPEQDIMQPRPKPQQNPQPTPQPPPQPTPPPRPTLGIQCANPTNIVDAIIYMDIHLWNYMSSNESTNPISTTSYGPCADIYNKNIKSLGNFEPQIAFKFQNPINALFTGMGRTRASYFMDGYNNVVNDKQLTNNDIVKYTIINLFPFAAMALLPAVVQNPEPKKLFNNRTKMQQNLQNLVNSGTITQDELNTIRDKNGFPNLQVCVSVLNKLLRLRGFPTIN